MAFSIQELQGDLQDFWVDGNCGKFYEGVTPSENKQHFSDANRANHRINNKAGVDASQHNP